MTRSNFGGSDTQALAILPPSANGAVVKSAPNITTGTAWSAETGGTQYTDLILPGGGACLVRTDADGFIRAMQGPDGVNEGMWVDLGSGTRFYLRTSDSLATFVDGKIATQHTADNATYAQFAGTNPFSKTGAGGFVGIEADGDAGISTFTPAGWRGATPPMRLRVSSAAPDGGGYGAQHFQIVPYEFGMAIEYPGVVETWTKEWSIHNNNQGSPDPGGAILWVGNDDDSGGLKVTSYKVGGTKHVTFSAEMFDHSDGGHLRFHLRNAADEWQFNMGADGAEVCQARITGAGQAHFMDGTIYETWIGAVGIEANEPGFALGIGADVRVYRGGTNILKQRATNVFKTGQDITANRPTAATVGAGAQFYDTTLAIPIWSDGAVWKNAAGTTV